jgi:CRISPR system Cascade subunit CasD
MAQFLLFDLAGAMAAWGEIAVGERRSTWDRPSKTAVLGLVAAAFGHPRDAENAHRALADGLGFGVLVREAGSVLRDFHTAQVPPGKTVYATRRAELGADKLGTIVSWRDYRCDAWATAVLWRHDDVGPALDEIRDRLALPHFTPYLGRRSCPLGAPLRARVVSADGIAAALAADTLPEWAGALAPGGRLYWDADMPPPGVAPVPLRSTVRRDALVSRQRHQFADRREAEAAWPTGEA